MYRIQGRYRPHFPGFTVSAILPMMGSFTASHTRAAMSMNMMNNGLRLKMSV